MNATANARAVLDAAANQILAAVAPDTSRLVRAYVALDEDAATAATDGIRIWLPLLFEGIAVAEDAEIAIDLLVHELGHFLQPLAKLDEVEQETGAPHWLANVVADIPLEAMMAGLFPPLAGTLDRVRQVVSKTRLAEYTAALLAGQNLPEIGCPLALAGRFGWPQSVFDDRGGEAGPLWGALAALTDRALAGRALAFAGRLCEALGLAADDLPEHLTQILAEFPELRQAQAAFAIPGGSLTVTGAAGQAAQAEASANTGGHPPVSPEPVVTVGVGPRRPRPEALQAARGLRVHFQVARSATEIVALARGEPVPLRMALPGKETPRSRAVICVDKFSSMKGNKLQLAQLAAQAVALAIQAAGGEVVGILFDDTAQVADSGDEALLTFDRGALRYGGTDFGFLIDAWRRWPEHSVLLVTDGQGAIPPAFPSDKARTAAILIPPD